MAGIASSIIGAFLQHQFAKERQEQAATQQQRQSQQEQQSRLQQALQMRDIVNDQQDRLQQDRIQDRQFRAKESLDQQQLQHRESRAQREHLADQARQSREMLFKEATKNRELAAKDRQAEWDRQLKASHQIWQQRLEETKVSREQSQKEAIGTPQVTSNMFKVDPETFQFIPVDNPDKPMRQLMAEGYRYLPENLRKDIRQLKATEFSFRQLQGSWSAVRQQSLVLRGLARIPGGTYINKEAAVFEKNATDFTSLFDSLIGGVRGGASPMLYEIRRKVLPDLLANPEVGDVIMTHMGQLVDTMMKANLNAMVGTPLGEPEQDAESTAKKLLGAYKRKGTATPTLPPNVRIR